jgi:hypothetical protein
MSNQICFQKAWLNLVPVTERANRDMLFEQRTSFGGRKATRTAVTLGLQETISGSGTQSEELVADLFSEMEMPMRFQGIK